MTQPGPFLKWAGEKSRLLPRILPRLPERIRIYYEPFLGGGSVFFALAREQRFRSAVLGDRNPELVEAFTVVRDDVEPLVEALGELAGGSSNRDYYHEVRSWNTDRLSAIQRGARFLFLNKTCFNGLYRVNRKGQFNVPFGRHKSPPVLNAPRLRAVSEALRGVTIVESDLASVIEHARAGDSVYLDPPYVPRTPTSSFTAYTAHAFTENDHLRLTVAYRQLVGRGVGAVLSNANTPVSTRLYRGLEVERVRAVRAINSVGSRQGLVSELLVVGVKFSRARAPSRRSEASARRHGPGLLRAR